MHGYLVIVCQGGAGRLSERDLISLAVLALYAVSTNALNFCKRTLELELIKGKGGEEIMP